MAIAGVDEDIYGDMTSKAVLELIEVFEKQGHSGMSASLVLSIFNRVVDFKNLSPLTNDPSEWQQHSESMWQNKRNSEAFSHDQGFSYSLTSETRWETDEYDRRVRKLTLYQTEHTHSKSHVETQPEEAQSNG